MPVSPGYRTNIGMADKGSRLHIFAMETRGRPVRSAISSSGTGVVETFDATLFPTVKAAITVEVLDRFGFSPRQCVFDGDSSSDIELFAWLPNTVRSTPRRRSSTLSPSPRRCGHQRRLPPGSVPACPTGLFPSPRRILCRPERKLRKYVVTHSKVRALTAPDGGHRA